MCCVEDCIRLIVPCTMVSAEDGTLEHLQCEIYIYSTEILLCQSVRWPPFPTTKKRASVVSTLNRQHSTRFVLNQQLRFGRMKINASSICQNIYSTQTVSFEPAQFLILCHSSVIFRVYRPDHLLPLSLVVPLQLDFNIRTSLIGRRHLLRTLSRKNF